MRDAIGLEPEHGVDWESFAPDEKKRALFAKQKALLDTFLRTGAIDQRQYRKSLTCMAEKMGIELGPEDRRNVL